MAEQSVDGRNLTKKWQGLDYIHCNLRYDLPIISSLLGHCASLRGKRYTRL